MKGVFRFQRFWGFLASWLGLSFSYWWLIGKVEVEHMIAAVLIGLGSALVLRAVQTSTRACWSFQARWLGILLRQLPVQIIRDCGLLGLQLGKSIAGGVATGALKRVPYRPQNDSRAPSQSALVIWGSSVPPNKITIFAEPKAKVLVIHELVFTSAMPENKELPL